MLIKRTPDRIKDVKKIGVYIGVPGLGDLIFIIPLFRALKRLFPGAKTVFIGKLLREYVRPVFDNCPYIDELLEYHFYEAKSLSDHLRFVRKLRSGRFDLLVDTQRKFVPSMLVAMGGARYVVSYSAGGIFSDFRVETPDRAKRHTADISLDLSRALGAKDPPLELEIGIPDENRRYAERFYSERGVAPGGLLVGFIPSAGHPSRRWNSEKFGRLADKVFSSLPPSPVGADITFPPGTVGTRKAKIICFGSLSDKPVIDEIILNTSAPVIVEDFERKSILDSAALMARCDVIVGVDSGPLHVADAAGVPCIGLYGPTLPDRFGLLGRRRREICLYVDCAPCENLDCEHRKCLEQITPEQVFEEVRQMIGEYPDFA